MNLQDALTQLTVHTKAIGVKREFGETIGLNITNELVVLVQNEDGSLTEDEPFLPTLADIQSNNWEIVLQQVTLKEAFKTVWDEVSTEFKTVRPFDESMLAQKVILKLETNYAFIAK